MVPDYPLGETLDFKFTTRSFSTGVPTQLAGTPVVDVYEDNSTTQITAGETLTVDFDSVTGLNNLRIVATSGNGYESGKSYAAVITTGTVGGVSVVGEVVAQFSIERSPALRPTTAGRTLDVNANGEAGLDLGNTSTVTLPGQTAPPLAPTGEQLLGHLYKAYRNRKTQTSTQWSLLADDESTVDQKATVSDDGTTAIKQEIVSGP